MGVQSLTAVCILYAIVRLAACLYALKQLLASLAESHHRQGDKLISVPMRKVFGFGGWATVSSTISPLMVYGDQFAITYFSGAASIAIYALLQELIGKTILLSASYANAIQPRLSYLPNEEAKILYGHERRTIIRLSAVVYTVCLLTAPFFVAVWLDLEAREVAFLRLLCP